MSEWNGVDEQLIDDKAPALDDEDNEYEDNEEDEEPDEDE